MKKIKQIFIDILYVSKLTRIKNKKLLITSSVILSQLSAATDLLLIGIFAAVITNQFTNIISLNLILEFFLDYKFLIALTVLLKYYLNYLQYIIMRNLEISVTVSLKEYMFEKVLEQKNYSKADTFYFINTLATHIAFFYSNFAMFMNHLLQVSAYFIYLVISDVTVVSFFVVGVFVLGLPIYKLTLLARRYMHRQFESGKDANRTLVNAVENLPLIRILRMERHEAENFSQNQKKVYNLAYKNYKVTFVNQALPNFFTLFIFALILNFSQLTQNLTLAFIGVTVRMFQSLSNISSSINAVANSQIHINEFVLLEKNDTLLNKDYFQIQEDGDISLEEISFKYANSNEGIFKDLNISFKKNTHNILIGANGTGKTTLLGLIGNILYPEAGKLTSFTESFSYIGATPFIFQNTLRENILYGNKLDVSDSEILDMLYKFDTFKEESSYDLNREVNNNTLSSGQLQKVAFVRALLSKPEVLLLDEAMANLDEHSKELVLTIMREMNITVINSTHDPDRFEDIDAIYKIEVVNEQRVVQKIK